MKGDVESGSLQNVETISNDPLDRPLSQIEKTFLLTAERGDCATVLKIINQYKDNPQEFDINCVDPLNRSALIAAIENENIELIRLLLEQKIAVKDGLLHAIKEEYVEAVEVLLIWEEEHHISGDPYSWESVDRSSSSFTADITPLILAAHKNNYEIIKILLDRGATLPMPHDVRCGCDECVESSTRDSLRHSQSRINAYKALTSSSLIALSSSDPLLTAFELSWDLRRLSKMETEFRSEYNEMRQSVQDFATALIDHARTSNELEIVLNYDTVGDTWEPGERQTLERLKLAIKYKQKQFIAHPSVQQLLAAIWYEGLPGFRRKNMVAQLFSIVQLGVMFPVYSSIYIMAPNSEKGQFLKKPFVKFICHSMSYSLFLMLLGAASQRLEIMFLEFFNIDWVQDMVNEWKRKERGALFGIAECGVILYVAGLIWAEIKSLWADGFEEYISDLWNVVDFITNMFYVIWFALRIASWFITWREESNYGNPWYPREMWDTFEPMLISEGAFAAGMIFSFLKLVHIFSVNPHLGPLQISLGRMIIDIVKFFFIYTLVLFAFGCGLNQLLWYYAELEKNKCYHLPTGLPDFENNDKACQIWRRYANLFETSQSLFWASFGLVDLLAFELTGIKGFTRFWALLMFGSYSVINIIVLLNMLIAMMSNSYQIISERSDMEWKFARSRLWISYFDDGDTLPPPFNLCPTPKNFLRKVGVGDKKTKTQSFKNRSKENSRERHEAVMKLLVRRYVTAEQRKRDDFGVTEDDVMEIRQDISTLRYELINILKNNGMKTPEVNIQDTQVSGKKGKEMERRILKDFHIGMVENLFNDLRQEPNLEAKNVFGQLAKAIGRRATFKSKSKKDWNAMVRKTSLKSDPIGSAQEAEITRARRQSIRQHILANVSKPSNLEDDKLLEYNPKLSEVPRTARVAYAKFMTKKMKIESASQEENKPEGETSMKRKSIGASVKFKVDSEEPATAEDSEQTLSDNDSSIVKYTDKLNTLAGSLSTEPLIPALSPVLEDRVLKPSEDGRQQVTVKPAETTQRPSEIILSPQNLIDLDSPESKPLIDLETPKPSPAKVVDCGETSTEKEETEPTEKKSPGKIQKEDKAEKQIKTESTPETSLAPDESKPTEERKPPETSKLPETATITIEAPPTGTGRSILSGKKREGWL